MAANRKRKRVLSTEDIRDLAKGGMGPALVKDDASMMAALRESVLVWKRRAQEAADEESRLRAIVCLLLRTHTPKGFATMSVEILARMRAEGWELERITDTEKKEVTVRLFKPADERPPAEPGAQPPLAILKDHAEEDAAAGGGTPCSTKFPEPPKS